LPVINNARHIVVLAAGENKTGIIRQLFIDDAGSDHYPVQRLHPAGELEWYLDAAAARSLTDGTSA
jgi:6-phosphogluconolactonase